MALLTVRAAAERMGVGYSTLKQWIYQGKIRTTQTAGGHHRLSEVEIDRLLARLKPSARAKPRDGGPPGGLIVALSGRNRLRGFVEEVRTDGLLGQVRLRIGDQLLRAVPELAKHFDRELVGMQKPQFLLYREGDFFRPHEDDSRGVRLK